MHYDFERSTKSLQRKIPQIINCSKEYLRLIFRIINIILIDPHFNDSQNKIFEAEQLPQDVFLQDVVNKFLAEKGENIIAVHPVMEKSLLVHYKE